MKTRIENSKCCRMTSLRNETTTSACMESGPRRFNNVVRFESFITAKSNRLNTHRRYIVSSGFHVRTVGKNKIRLRTAFNQAVGEGERRPPKKNGLGESSSSGEKEWNTCWCDRHVPDRIRTSRVFSESRTPPFFCHSFPWDCFGLTSVGERRATNKIRTFKKPVCSGYRISLIL
jgi:hypothetical protein